MKVVFLVHAWESVNLYAIGVLLNNKLICSGRQVDCIKTNTRGEDYYVYRKFVFILLFVENRKMSFVMAMNGDNPNTSITEKIGGFLQISLLA